MNKFEILYSQFNNDKEFINDIMEEVIDELEYYQTHMQEIVCELKIDPTISNEIKRTIIYETHKIKGILSNMYFVKESTKANILLQLCKDSIHINTFLLKYRSLSEDIDQLKKEMRDEIRANQR